MDRVFVDSDVILDLFIARKPFHETALRFFSRINGSKTAAFTSPLIIANVHYVLSRIRSPAYALAKVRAVRALLSIAPITEEIMDAAITGRQKDFEDGIQYQCAAANGMNVFITRNVKHFPAHPVSVLDPEAYLLGVQEHSAFRIDGCHG
jgi:predicted nucleic acid-binding protein